MSIRKIKKVLIANRSEIAVRVIKACREMGIETVAVFSEVDRKALHVLEADQAVEIGRAEASESYLNIDKIIEAAQTTKCDAIHPGYGFLSENAHFARRCRKAEIIFIGPSPEALQMVGDKIRARQTMMDAAIPLPPGFELHATNWKETQKRAEEIGYPLIIKATAGGGGKGMRIVRHSQDLSPAIEVCQREAKAAFGSDQVFMEKFIENPRHIEFQVIADHYGNTIHLYERECSIQRRHQKIIEETPSPVLNEELRQKMGNTACKVMKAVKYSNAGTVEFLLDKHNNFYFLEVNARIQVEHPVTEMVTGVDLVKQQIGLAEGKRLTLKQSDIQQIGHAIECRIYAEDPENNFFPSLGKLLFVKEPHGPGIRCDSSIYSGFEVSSHYDPILSKLITRGENRQDSLQKMRIALSEYIILGIKSPIPFLRAVLDHPQFIKGDLTTAFIDNYFANWQAPPQNRHLNIALLTAAKASEIKANSRTSLDNGNQPSPWFSIGEWELLS